MMKIFTSTLAVVATMATTALAQTFNGNGGTSFDGAIGTGSLTFSSDGTTLFGTITRGSGGVDSLFNDVLVIYIDSVAGGFSDTSMLADGQDGLRRAVSGFDGGTNRSLFTMPGGFQADYALALGPSSDSFGGLFQLIAGGNDSLGFVSTANLEPLNNNSATYTFSISLASIGLTGADQFNFVSTYISNTGYRSNESIATGLSGTPQDPNGSYGYSPVVATDFATVPEPSTISLLAGAVLVGAWRLRRRVN